MGTTFRKYQPEQSFLLPPSPRDWLPEDHLSYFISETVDELDLSGFYAPYEGDGRRNRPFDPRMMVKILIYGYATGTFSSRKLARRVYEDVAVRVLSAGNFPAHRTMAEFRQRHLKEFKKLFGQVARIAAEAGLVKLGRVAVDGCKIKANASKHKAMSYSRMLEEGKRLEGEIAELLDRAQQVDKAEDELYGEENQGDELPEELRRREDRLKKIGEAKQRVEQRQAEADRKRGRKPGDGRKNPRGGRPFKREFGVPEEKAQDNFTDPESRIMKSSGGFEQYRESDHVLNLIYNVMTGGSCLQDVEARRRDPVYLDALGARKVPAPSTEGDFLRRFDRNSIWDLMEAVNEARRKVWSNQDKEFHRQATIDVDGTIAPTDGQCKSGIGMSYTGHWSYHPLVVSVAELENRLQPATRSRR